MLGAERSLLTKILLVGACVLIVVSAVGMWRQWSFEDRIAAINTKIEQLAADLTARIDKNMIAAATSRTEAEAARNAFADRVYATSGKRWEGHNADMAQVLERLGTVEQCVLQAFPQCSAGPAPAPTP